MMPVINLRSCLGHKTDPQGAHLHLRMECKLVSEQKNAATGVINNKGLLHMVPLKPIVLLSKNITQLTQF